MLTPCKMSSVTPREFLTEENKNENAHLAKHKSREFFKYLNVHEAKLNFKSHFEFSRQNQHKYRCYLDHFGARKFKV